MDKKLINVEVLFSLIDLQTYCLVAGLFVGCWAFYKFFLRDASDERHRNLKSHHKNLLRHFLMLSLLFSAFNILHKEEKAAISVQYIAILTLIWGVIVLVKTSRLSLLQYLFLTSMKHGVPLLLVNIFSLLLSVALTFWIASNIFDFHIAPLLATSAAFSIILGLAMQDTLGNLFAGISLQIDKAYEIGDWLEITNGAQKTSGQVKEISWRATVLQSWTEEMITIPNRVLASSQIANFTMYGIPVIRSQIFRLPYSVDVNLAKWCLLESLKEIKEIKAWPEPLCIITETTDSWLGFKLVYYIDNFGGQFVIGDQVLTAGLKYLKFKDIHTTTQKVEILQNQPLPLNT